MEHSGAWTMEEAGRMKRAGLLGGMSWESTVTYYKIINERIREVLGGSSSADMIIRSLDLAVIDGYQSHGEWDAVAGLLCKAAGELEQLNADFIVMASNTVHRVYDDVRASISIPVLHIAEPTVEAVHSAGIRTVGLLGTKYTMQGDFLKERLDAAGIQVIVPAADQMDRIHEAIFSEACLDRGQAAGEMLQKETGEMFREVIRDFRERGAEGILLGCTELGLMIRPEDSCPPLFDTAELHAEKAAEMMLG